MYSRIECMVIYMCIHINGSLQCKALFTNGTGHEIFAQYTMDLTITAQGQTIETFVITQVFFYLKLFKKSNIL